MNRDEIRIEKKAIIDQNAAMTNHFKQSNASNFNSKLTQVISSLPIHNLVKLTTNLVATKTQISATISNSKFK